ncbi:hypothetical protein E2320_006887 [Naja naja]|nr:hypothetical protein E2320_006887 [Naja naja]
MAGVSNYTTLTLADRKGLLYVGAREAIFALSISTMEMEEAILWEAPAERKAECIQKGRSNQTECFNYIRFLQTYNSSHMYTCGTYAFQPKCGYIDLATFSLDRFSFEEGKGKCPYDPAKGYTSLIVEEELYSATHNNFLGTDPVILRNLGPQYPVKTEHLPTERAVEYDCDIDQVVARVARICKGDVGGARTLQKRWTTFLKARLLCSIPEQQLHFNRIQGTYTLNGDHWRETSFFGVFQARCTRSWMCRKSLKVPTRNTVKLLRSGFCITDWHRYNSFSTSLELPDNTLNFAKKHPLMDKAVPPHGNQPLLVKKDANFTQLVNGWLHKAVALSSGVHLIEELQVFEEAQPIKSLVLSVPKDPYCAWTWNGSRCVRIDAYDGTSILFQDLGMEPMMCNPLRSSRPGTKIISKNITAMVGMDLVLPCQLTSNLAKALWTFNGQDLAESQASVVYDAHLQALIVLDIRLKHSGLYKCIQLEEMNELMTESYQVTVLADPAMSMETRAPLDNLGLVWVVVIALSAICVVLLLVVFSLKRRLKEEREKGSKAIESTLVYPIEMPKEPKSPTFIPSTTSDSDEKLWDPASYYYSDGSLKIVPGHAVCQNGGTTPSPTTNGIPGQPLQSPHLHSPNRINLSNIRGSSSNGYIRLNLGTEERPDYSDLAEELRRKLKQRQALPDSNPEESSV